MQRSSSLALSFALTLAASLPALAAAQTSETDDEAAHRHFAIGRANYANRGLDTAATELDEAYRLIAPRPLQRSTDISSSCPTRRTPPVHCDTCFGSTPVCHPECDLCLSSTASCP